MAQLPAIEDVSGEIVANRFMEYEELYQLDDGGHVAGCT
jgi:hypothetical protein